MCLKIFYSFEWTFQQTEYDNLTLSKQYPELVKIAHVSASMSSKG